MSGGDLTNADVEALTSLCKATHGLGIAASPYVLAEVHLAITGANLGPVTLASVTHHAGVNAWPRSRRCGLVRH